MTKLSCELSISLDGFTAGPNPSEQDPQHLSAGLLDELRLSARRCGRRR